MTRRGIAWTLGIIAVLASVIPAFAGVDEPIAIHHLDHSGLVLLGAAAAFFVRDPSAKGSPASGARWLVLTVLAPIAMMFVMWPSLYDYLDAHASLHALEHLVLAALGYVAVAAGERYVRGVGATMGVLMFVMAVLSAAGYGVMKP
ncbi:hypothetical protein EPN52_04620 [bacterium]|nr:MAG: hypothetical protein EPN52_04620 [bacterium]